MNEVQRNFHVAPGLGGDLLLNEHHARVERLAYQSAESGIPRKHLVEFRTEYLGTAHPEKPLHGIADQNRARIMGVQQDAVLQVRHDLVEVFLKSRENFLD